MNSKAQIELTSILNDTISGSAEILEKINSYIILHVSNKVELKSIMRQVKIQFPFFAGIQNYILVLRRLCEKKSFNEVIQFIENSKQEMGYKFNLIFENAKCILQSNNKIISLSNSLTLKKFFQIGFLQNLTFKVFVLESLPGGEGKVLCSNLKKLGINAELLEDHQLSKEVIKIDTAIIGCDMISEDGSVINKIGSRLLAAKCKSVNKPFYVLGDKTKIVTQKRFLRRVKELNKNSGKALFESIEKELITQIITD